MRVRGDVVAVKARRRHRAPGLRELAVLAALYVGYSATRLLAADDAAAARSTAREVLRAENWLGIDVEHTLAVWTHAHVVVAVVASYWYAVAHYVVTAAVLLWVWWRHRDRYAVARDTLVLATVGALAIYLLMPTAPPRFLAGYPDVLASTASWGWWQDASAPRGLGGITNQLAAMPSMHVGWAVWVALTLRTCWTGVLARRLVWAYPLVTALVVVATANHWVADAVVGAVFVGLAHCVSCHRSAASSCAASSP